MPRRQAEVHETVRFNVERWTVEYVIYQDIPRSLRERLVVKIRGPFLNKTRWRRAKAVHLTIWADLTEPDEWLPRNGGVGVVEGIRGGELMARVSSRPTSVSLLLQGLTAGRVPECTLSVRVGERGKGTITLFAAEDPRWEGIEED